MGLFLGNTVPRDEYDQLLEDYEGTLSRVAELESRAAQPTEWLEAVMTKRLVVHLTNDSTIVGSLVARMDDGIVLRAAVLMDGSPNGTSMAGEVFVPRDKVAFAQLDG